MKKIPDRWLDYKAIGKVVDGSNFIAFKVPLHKHISECLPSDERHTTVDVVKAIPNLGIVINLTNTQNDTKYYSPRDWQEHGIEYKWIKTEGHVTPSQSNLVQFCRTVKNFLIGNPEKLVGVHCTHGLNRTGYFVCSYMVLCNNLSPSEAMRNFNDARGHHIERANYISSVMTHSSNENLKQAVERRGTTSRPTSRNARAISASRRGDILPAKRSWPNSRPSSRDNSRHRVAHNNSYSDRREISDRPNHRNARVSRWGNDTRHAVEQNERMRGSGRNETHNRRNEDRHGAYDVRNVRQNERPDNSSRWEQRSGGNSNRREGNDNAPKWRDRNVKWGERSANPSQSQSQDPGWSQWVNQRMGNEKK